MLDGWLMEDGMAIEQQHVDTASIYADGRPSSGQGTEDATRDQAVGLAPRRLVPVALSALLEGLGQAYNRQPVKAAGLAVAGLGLSTASGLNTWLMRHVFRAKGVTIGTERIRPWLLAAWAVTYAFSLWDAWAGAPEPEAE